MRFFSLIFLVFMLTLLVVIKMILRKDIIDDSNPLLRKKSEDVALPLSVEDEKLLDDMMEYLEFSQDEEKSLLYDIQPGVGLAAPQLGILKKMFVVLAEDEKGMLHKYALVNPKIISHSVANCHLATGEGCLSVKDSHNGYVKRHYKIKMKAYDHISKKDVLLNLKGYIAIVLQHEYDHLFGILYYDHINKEKPLDKSDGSIEII